MRGGAELLVRAGGLSAGLAATIMSLFLGATVVGRTVGSWLTRRGSSTRLFFCALGLAGVGFLLFWLAPSAPLMVVGLVIAGLGVANFYPLALTMAVSAAPGQSDAASARAAFGNGTATLTMPLLLGGIADIVGEWNAYSLVGVLILAALVLARTAVRGRPGEQTAALEGASRPPLRRPW